MSENEGPPIRAVSADSLPDYETDGPPPLPWWKAWASKRWVWIGAFVLVFGCLVVALGPGTYRELKARRAVALIREGENALEKGDHAMASNRFLAAFSLAPGDDRVLSVLVRHTALGGDPQSIRRLRERFESGTANPEDLLALGEVAMNSNDFETLEQVIDFLPHFDQPEGKYRADVLEAVHLANRGWRSDALKLLKEAQPPVGREGQLHLLTAKILLDGQRPAPDIISALESASQDRGPHGLEALRMMLALNPPPKREVYLRWAAALRSHPLRNPEDVQNSVNRSLAYGFLTRAEMLAQLVSEAESLPLRDRTSHARAITRLGGAPETVRLLSSEGEVLDQSGVVAMVEALGHLGKIAEAKEALAASGNVVEPLVRELLLALLAGVEGGGADDHWLAFRKALAGASPGALQEVAPMLVGINRPTERLRVLETLFTKEAASPPQLQELLASLPTDSNPSQFLAIYDFITARLNQDLLARSLRVYYSLMAGSDPEQALEEAEALYQEAPNVLPAVAVLALARLMNGDREGAAGLFAGQTVPWEGAPHGIRVSYVAVLRASGQHDAADVVQKQMSPLSAPEARLLRQFPERPGAEN